MPARSVSRWSIALALATVAFLVVSGPAGAQEAIARYTVVRGDTLTAIARDHGTTIQALMSANDIARADHIYVGQALVIPVTGNPPPSEKPVEANATPSPTPTGSHTVASGETLMGIALRYGVSPEALAQYNNIANPRLIFAGQVLQMPPAGYSPSPAAAPDPVPTAAPAPTTILPEPGPGTYTIRRGDSLSAIASRLGVALDDLLSLNDIADPNLIHAGLILTLPAGAATAPTPAPDATPVPTMTEGKHIVVSLSHQRVYAFENGTQVAEFLVSTGLPGTPTIQGQFAIYLKIPIQRMYGPGYDLPNVRWVSYFVGDYSLHGTYWHDNFGQPMSRGCVNMREADAQWIYDWAPVGTSVLVGE